jgi:hypothetical protein
MRWAMHESLWIGEFTIYAHRFDFWRSDTGQEPLPTLPTRFKSDAPAAQTEYPLQDTTNDVLIRLKHEVASQVAFPYIMMETLGTPDSHQEA